MTIPESRPPNRQVEREMSFQEWSDIRAGVLQSGFWHAHTHENSPGPDGTYWILEVSEPDRYHVVARWGEPSLGAIMHELRELSVIALGEGG